MKMEQKVARAIRELDPTSDKKFSLNDLQLYLEIESDTEEYEEFLDAIDFLEEVGAIYGIRDEVLN